MITLISCGILLMMRMTTLTITSLYIKNYLPLKHQSHYISIDINFDILFKQKSIVGLVKHILIILGSK